MLREEYVRVIKTEEKGSDDDARMGRFEVAVVVSALPPSSLAAS